MIRKIRFIPLALGCPIDFADVVFDCASGLVYPTQILVLASLSKPFQT